jgi:hypothetical protein
MTDAQERLIRTGRSYFEEVVRPWLVGRNLFQTSLVAFSGSVAYGYADRLSDIEMEVCLKDKPRRSEIRDFRKEVVAKHPRYRGVRMSVGDLNTGWKLDLVLRNRMKQFWKDWDPLVLFEMTHAVPIWDPMGAASVLKRRVAFYPRPIFVRMVRELWLKTNDSAAYNALFATRRGNETSANIFLYRGIEALLRMIFLLNRTFYPHTKWIPNELEKLPNSFDARTHLERINRAESPSVRQKEFGTFLDEVKAYLTTGRVLPQEFVDDPWKIWHLLPSSEAMMQ